MLTQTEKNITTALHQKIPAALIENITPAALRPASQVA
jgi:hypothetical protein